MGQLDMSDADHAAIRTSSHVQKHLAEVAAQIAATAGSAAGDPGGYETDLVVGTDRARAHVRPKSPAAYRAEAKFSPLMQAVASNGPRP
ncbi:hypothetical protein [Mycobacteroides chelonae]|uniref:hypothetical protein n=1 Tax=Mycobacteroides chelonae TaxID=1774 RepID=UPI0018E310FE|nr:hypothetical protein [Mycobacteroides chelonae]